MLQTATMDFFTPRLDNILVMCGIVFTYLNYRRDLHKDQAQRVEMHVENRTKLDTLAAFHTEQLEVNRRRDRQIAELSKQTTALTEIAKGLDRRLEMLEDRRSS